MVLDAVPLMDRVMELERETSSEGDEVAESERVTSSVREIEREGVGTRLHVSEF